MSKASKRQSSQAGFLFRFFGFRNVGSRWAMDQAKYNLINEYFLVGVTEELEDFVMLLEAALPRFFRGATELYRTGVYRMRRFGTRSFHRHVKDIGGRSLGA